MRKKRIIFILVCTLPALFLAACGAPAGPAADMEINQPEQSDELECSVPDATPEDGEQALAGGPEQGESVPVAQQEPPVSADDNVRKEETPAMPELPTPLSEEELYAVYNNTLFIGDSRTEGFKLHSDVTNATYFCAKSLTVDRIVEGEKISSAGSSYSLQDMLSAASYDKVIISVGLNELGWNHIETFIESYEKLIEIVRDSQPQAAIYVQALLPVTAAKSASHKYNNNAQIYWYNTNIVEMAERVGVNYVNAAPAVVDTEGNLMSDAASDGIHLNKDYCKKWAEYLATLL